METKKVTKKSKSQSKNKSVRLSMSTYESANRWVEFANEKKAGSKIKLDQVLNLAVSLLTPEHIKKLQSDSLKGSDLQEIMRQKYIKQFGHISKEDYIAFTTTSAYVEFLIAQNDLVNLEVAV